jgi:hypothetical protein
MEIVTPPSGGTFSLPRQKVLGLMVVGAVFAFAVKPEQKF